MQHIILVMAIYTLNKKETFYKGGLYFCCFSDFTAISLSAEEKEHLEE